MKIIGIGKDGYITECSKEEIENIAGKVLSVGAVVPLDAVSKNVKRIRGNKQKLLDASAALQHSAENVRDMVKAVSDVLEGD